MLNNIRAEHLKCKRTFAKKLVIIAPVCMLLLALITGKYFVENGYNFWYVLILPGFVTLLSAMVNQNEDNKLRYRALFALPISLNKIWIAKVLLIAIYVIAANIIHLTGILLGKLIYVSSDIAFYQAIAASMILVVTSLWQIPLCLFLSKKFGLMAAVLINLGGGTVLQLLTASEFFWWACPYSWATRLMCPVLGVLPQGTIAQAGDPMLNSRVIPLGILLSLLLFALLLIVTAHWFSKQEVK